MNTNETMIKITIEGDENTTLERYADMIDRRCTDVARLISKDTSFNNETLQKIYTELCNLEADYSHGKTAISDKYARPLSVEKWGETAVVNWSIDFATQVLSITYSGSDNRQTTETDIEMNADFVEKQRDLSIKRTALADIIDRVIQIAPTIDNTSFTELQRIYDEVEDAYQDNIKIIDREYVRAWFEANEPNAPLNTRSWSLDFDTKKVTVSYAV